MKAPKEIRKWISHMRSYFAAQNRRIPRIAWDAPKMENKLAKSKKRYQRNRIKQIDDRQE